MQESCQEGLMFVPQSATRKGSPPRHQTLYPLPLSRWENGVMFARVALPLVQDRACIKDIAQQPVQRVQRKWSPGTEFALLASPALQPPAAAIDFGQGLGRRPCLLEYGEYGGQLWLSRSDDAFHHHHKQLAFIPSPDPTYPPTVDAIP